MRSSSSPRLICDVLGSRSVFEARSQQKIWCLHMFLYCVPLFSRVDVVWLCAPEEGRLFVGACCVWFVVMIPLHEAFVYIPPPKNRGSLWQHRRRLTCDMLERFRSERVTPSPNLLFLPSLFAFFHSSFTITFSLWGFPLVFFDPLFLYCGLHFCSLPHSRLRLAHDCGSKNSTDTW